MRKLSFLLVLMLSILAPKAYACSPCGALSNVTQTNNGNTLDLTFSSNAGWQCCYTVNIEIVCANASFTGVATHFSSEICINGGNCSSCTISGSFPYPTTSIDLTSLCPGTYKWRAWETPCYIYTPEQTFTVAGVSPIQVGVNLSEDTLCISESSQFSTTATSGCSGGTYSYAWAPAVGLSNASIANPIATPSVTTTYTVTVTENGSCTAPQTAAVTLNVAPMPTATIGQNSALCEDTGPSPNITFNGSSATAPYIINYSLNGVAQPPIITIGNSNSFPFPTDTPGTYVFSLIDVTESSANQCSQPQAGTATITIWPNPVVNAGQDIILCEPGGTSPSDVTLTGTGATTYTWDNSAMNGVPFTPPAGTTLFTLTGTDANGCTDTDQVSVTSLPQPLANGMPSDTYGNVPMIIDFTNLSQYASNYLWDFGNGQTIDTNSTTTVTTIYNVPGIYTIILTASNGICTDTWDTIVEVLPPMIVTPPNVFTPNEDGANELYFVDVKYGEQFEAIIVNRWGNLMATISGINQGWDGKTGGKNCEEGVYFIKYKATDFNGNEVEGHTYFHLFR